MAGSRCDCAACVRDQRFLQARVRPAAPSRRRAPVTLVDLFAGCGGLSCGLLEAASRVNRRLDVRLAVEIDPAIAAIYKRNFPKAPVIAGDVAATFPGEPGDALRPEEETLSKAIGRPDFLVAGPPCQGHSDLNNHTRREDPKNALYLTVARAAEVLRPTVILIENVPAVQHDRHDVAGQTVVALEKLEYAVTARVVDLSVVGVPQRRRRYVLLASASAAVDPARELDQLVESWGHHPARDVAWAIGDLHGVERSSAFDQAGRRSKENDRRIAYLFDHGLHDLPNAQRPRCHRDFEHSYKSVYGRLRWDLPAQTITTGFGSMGQGRYVHPSERRTITPHEAARLQGFPDWFDWGTERRTLLSTTIGNAVPPLLTVALGSAVLQALGRSR